MRHILSTKKLETGQRELLLNTGFGLVEQNFISISFIDFKISSLPENLIFTSKNAVKAVLRHPALFELKTKKVFAVGLKTTRYLVDHGFTVIQTADYGRELAEKILKDHSLLQEQYLFFCGSKRNPDLPQSLRSAGVRLSEVVVYQTRSTPKKIDRIFDGVLFFSPSGVASYCSQNSLDGSVSFCIGSTTAFEAKKYTDQIVTATRPTVENVLVQVVKYYKPNGEKPNKN